MQPNIKDYFLCYSPQISRFLRDRGIYQILKATDVKTGNDFRLYLRCGELQEALDEYKNRG